jgi:hypothetical protein
MAVSWVLFLATACAALAAAGAARADETDFRRRFSADWSGGGRVVRDADKEPKPVNVSCRLNGRSEGATIDLGGTCRAYLVFTRPFGATVRYDPATGRYTGIYRGARSGPAQLSGRRQGDTVNFIVTWAKPINGDRTARLSIRNDGKTMAIRLVDEAKGRQVTTTDLTFAQR